MENSTVKMNEAVFVAVPSETCKRIGTVPSTFVTEDGRFGVVVMIRVCCPPPLLVICKLLTKLN